eukprot:1481096-Pyramimonas_sp.AAC.2
MPEKAMISITAKRRPWRQLSVRWQQRQVGGIRGVVLTICVIYHDLYPPDLQRSTAGAGEVLPGSNLPHLDRDRCLASRMGQVNFPIGCVP